jgi:hypothetical protein
MRYLSSVEQKLYVPPRKKQLDFEPVMVACLLGVFVVWVGANFVFWFLI